MSLFELLPSVLFIHIAQFLTVEDKCSKVMTINQSINRSISQSGCFRRDHIVIDDRFIIQDVTDIAQRVNFGWLAYIKDIVVDSSFNQSNFQRRVLSRSYSNQITDQSICHSNSLSDQLSNHNNHPVRKSVNQTIDHSAAYNLHQSIDRSIEQSKKLRIRQQQDDQKHIQQSDVQSFDRPSQSSNQTMSQAVDESPKQRRNQTINQISMKPFRPHLHPSVLSILRLAIPFCESIALRGGNEIIDVVNMFSETINQSNNQTVDRIVDQSTDEPSVRLIHYLTNRPKTQSIKQSINRSICRLTLKYLQIRFDTYIEIDASSLIDCLSLTTVDISVIAKRPNAGSNSQSNKQSIDQFENVICSLPPSVTSLTLGRHNMDAVLLIRLFMIEEFLPNLKIFDVKCTDIQDSLMLAICVPQVSLSSPQSTAKFFSSQLLVDESSSVRSVFQSTFHHDEPNCRTRPVLRIVPSVTMMCMDYLTMLYRSTNQSINQSTNQPRTAVMTHLSIELIDEKMFEFCRVDPETFDHVLSFKIITHQRNPEPQNQSSNQTINRSNVTSFILIQMCRPRVRALTFKAEEHYPVRPFNEESIVHLSSMKQLQSLTIHLREVFEPVFDQTIKRSIDCFIKKNCFPNLVTLRLMFVTIPIHQLKALLCATSNLQDFEYCRAHQLKGTFHQSNNQASRQSINQLSVDAVDALFCVGKYCPMIKRVRITNGEFLDVTLPMMMKSYQHVFCEPDQSINQTINHSVSQPANQSNNQSNNQCTSQLLNFVMSQPSLIEQLINIPVIPHSTNCQIINQSINQLQIFPHLIRLQFLIGRFRDDAFHFLLRCCKPKNRSTNQSINQTNNQSITSDCLISFPQPVQNMNPFKIHMINRFITNYQPDSQTTFDSMCEMLQQNRSNNQSNNQSINRSVSHQSNNLIEFLRVPNYPNPVLETGSVYDHLDEARIIHENMTSNGVRIIFRRPSINQSNNPSNNQSINQSNSQSFDGRQAFCEYVACHVSPLERRLLEIWDSGNYEWKPHETRQILEQLGDIGPKSNKILRTM